MVSTFKSYTKRKGREPRPFQCVCAAELDQPSFCKSFECTILLDGLEALG